MTLGSPPSKGGRTHISQKGGLLANELNPMKTLDSASSRCGARTRLGLPCKAHELWAVRVAGCTAVHLGRAPLSETVTVVTRPGSTPTKLRRNDAGLPRWSEPPKEIRWITPPRSCQPIWHPQN